MNACPSGKKRHGSRKDAAAHLARLWRKGRGVLPRRTYQCPKCNGWHLTKQPWKGKAPPHGRADSAQ